MDNRVMKQCDKKKIKGAHLTERQKEKKVW